MRSFRKKSPSSVTPTNSPPPTPKSPITEYIKKELATFHPRTKDRRALAASSSAIAISILSSSHDPADTMPNEPGSSKESGWRTAYGAARMAVEIANASSDMFLPLKAVVGALSVLIKNYDQFSANVEQVGDIEKRVQSVAEALTYPVGDQDSGEKARREALRRKLDGIITELGPLSEQHGIMRFLKNDDHAKILNGFVQDLAYAITDYQTSLQQSIHENTRKIDETANGINETTNRIDETACMINEIANETNVTAKRIDETTKNIGESAQHIIEATDLELLGKLEPVRNAGYQAGHHDTCLRGTRESVLDGIMRWAKDPQDRHVFWLNGLAGTGKSTIAQTFSEMVAKAGTLGASFFCSRDYLDRRELKNIFPTLAYQLACRYPAFRHHIVRVIKRDPTVASNSLISQLEDLIVGPLSSTNISCVIVVDALDECIDDQPASAILSVLGRHAKQLSHVKFFITGRPEPRIRTGFRLPLLEPLTQIFLLHEVKPSSVDEDIRLYLQEKLTAVSIRRSDLDLPNPWPCGEELTTLTEKSSGLFIFASTLVRFIESEHHEPNERLHLIITPSDSTVNEGRAGIDPLYTQILVHAFSDVKDTTLFTNLRRVLGAVVLAFNPLSRAQIAGILGVNTSLIARSLRHLHSVLLIPAEDSKEIRVFHKSFPDFLQDRNRCSDSRFFIDSPAHHGDIALDCLELSKKLKPNPCDLPDFVMNREVADLPELLEDKVGGATRYACGYWAMHVRSSPTIHHYAIQLIPSATDFFEKNAVPWIEVMSLENRLESVVHIIYDLFDWLGSVHDVPAFGLRRLAQDCLRFTMQFFHPIQESALHVYHSALPLSPESSMFHPETSHEKTKVAGFYGQPDAWGVVVRTITAGSKPFTCMTTFGHRIAAACEDGKVYIYDSVTGVLRLSLSPTDHVQAVRGSPDGSVLFCAHKTPSITAWDMQTGGLTHTIVSRLAAEDIAVSLKGHYLACGLSDGSVDVWEVANKMGDVVDKIRSPVTHFCWLAPEGRLAILRGAWLDVRDVTAGKLLYGFPIQRPAHRMVYSQKFNLLAIMSNLTLKNAITIVNPQMEASTFPHTHENLSGFTFSQTTGELVCSMGNHRSPTTQATRLNRRPFDVSTQAAQVDPFDAPTQAARLHLFDVLTQRWRHIEYPDTITSVSSLPNGTVATNSVGSGIQLLGLDGGHTSSQQPDISALAVHALDQGTIITILLTSRDRIVLLEPVTMSQFLTIPIQNTNNPARILCASLKNHTAIYCFEEGGKEYVQLWRLHNGDLKWTVGIGGPPSIGRISPSGTQLMTFHHVDFQTCISVWDTQSGQLKAQLQTDPTYPLDITFDSETRFYSHHDTYRVPFVVSPFKSEDLSHSIRSMFHTSTHPITRHEQLPLIGEPQKRDYDVDETREWVVSGAKRVCWIPPGYIGSTQPSYCWAGHSLVMAGQDGTLRKLTFREPN